MDQREDAVYCSKAVLASRISLCPQRVWSLVGKSTDAVERSSSTKSSLLHNPRVALGNTFRPSLKFGDSVDPVRGSDDMTISIQNSVGWFD